MPITRVRIVDPRNAFEEQPGVVVRIFQEDGLTLEVLFPEAMVSDRSCAWCWSGICGSPTLPFPHLQNT